MTTSFDFLSASISQADIATFSDDKVNLKRDHAQRYREQVGTLRNHLDRYIEEHPDIGLVKMLLSGSLAKGTALRTINDVDVALYVKGDSAPSELNELLNWLVEKLRKTYWQIAPEDIRIDGPAIVISFSGTGIDVDVIPIYYLGDPDWRGYLWDRRSGQKLLTSIPQHLDFIRRRKQKQPSHFAQTIRLVKWWAQQREREDPTFSVRSFLIELLLSKLVDSGKLFSDYHVGLEHFFLYVQKSSLQERVSFTDFYPASKLPKQSATVEVFDPVNPENNVGSDMTEATRRKFLLFAEQALDALSYAKTAQTKREALECWQDVMGASFNA